MRKLGIILFVIGCVMLLIGALWITIDMLIDHQCYQLAPNEFYKSTICERYWKYEE